MAEQTYYIPFWVRHVLTDLKVHDLSGWGMVLGVPVAKIESWVRDGALPPPRPLRDILLTLRRRSSIEGVTEALRSWDAIAASGGGALGRYALEPLWDNLRMALGSLPLNEQEAFLERFLQSVSRRRVPRAFPDKHEMPLEAFIESLSPEHSSELDAVIDSELDEFAARVKDSAARIRAVPDAERSAVFDTEHDELSGGTDHEPEEP